MCDRLAQSLVPKNVNMKLSSVLRKQHVIGCLQTWKCSPGFSWAFTSGNRSGVFCGGCQYPSILVCLFFSLFFFVFLCFFLCLCL